MKPLVLLVLAVAPLAACNRADDSKRANATRESDERVCESRRRQIREEQETHRLQRQALKKDLSVAEAAVKAARDAGDTARATGAEVRVKELVLRLDELEKAAAAVDARKKAIEAECKPASG